MWSGIGVHYQLLDVRALVMAAICYRVYTGGLNIPAQPIYCRRLSSLLPRNIRLDTEAFLYASPSQCLINIMAQEEPPESRYTGHTWDFMLEQDEV